MIWFLSQDCENDYTEEPTYGYRQKRTEDVEIVAIAECHTCGSLMTETEEVVTYNSETFCGEPCVVDYLRMMEE